MKNVLIALILFLTGFSAAFGAGHYLANRIKADGTACIQRAAEVNRDPNDALRDMEKCLNSFFGARNTLIRLAFGG